MPKLIHYRDNCIGCYSCVEVAPNNWEIGPDGKATLKRSEQKKLVSVAEISEFEIDCNQCAAAACPMNIIRVIDNQGKEL